MSSKSSRSSWKLPFVSPFFFSNFFFNVSSLNTKLRNSTITNIFLDKKLRVHNGLKFVSFLVTDKMLGKKLGEFSISKVLGTDIYFSKIRKAKEKKKKKKKK